MSYIVSEVITMARRFLIDSADKSHTDADMLAYTNEGQKRFSSETQCCQAVVDVTPSANPITYAQIVSAIGSSAEQILSIVKVTPKSGDNYTPLPFAPVSEMKELPVSATTAPTRWNNFAEVVRFDLHPDTAYTTVTRIECSFTTADLSAVGDTILTPDEWIQGLVKYVEFCCRIAERDAGGANGAYAEFEAIKLAAAAIVKQRSIGGMG